MIKKTILLVTLVGFTFISCKKEEKVTPTESTEEVTPNDSTDTDDVDDGSTEDSDDDTSTETDPIQDKLDKGMSPVEIYNSDTTLLESLYGKTYAGGLIFYLNMADSSGMVASSVDQSTSQQWGCNTTLLSEYVCLPGAFCFYENYAGAQGIGYGAANSEEIVTHCSSSAAQKSTDLVLEGYSDWFMPSMQEAKLMYTKLNLTGTYWTSSQQSSDRSWSVSSGTDGTIHLTLPKSGWKKVRSVRSF